METAVMYNKNTPLMRVRMKNGSITGVAEVLNTQLLPIILQNGDSAPDVSKINRWIERRMIPDKRDGIKSVRDTFRYFRAGGDMFSLSDQYWFQHDAGQRWEDLNFFRNGYDENTGRAFFTPWELEKDQKFGRSPDYAIPPPTQEPITEVLASEMLSKLDIIPYVSYTLTIEGMTLCSSCANFVGENTEFVPAVHLYKAREKSEKTSAYQHLLNMCDVFGVQNAKEYIDGMITADRILGNDDRHLGNFGFIRDAGTGRILGFAPIFDSGSAYGGKINRGGSQRLFGEGQIKASIRATINKINYRRMCDHEDMFELLRIYPNIGREQKECIKTHMLNTEKEVERLLIRGRKVNRQGDLER